MRRSKMCIALFSTAFIWACGPQKSQSDLRSNATPEETKGIGYIDQDGNPVLAKTENDKEIDTLKIPISTNPDGSFSLANAESWEVDMEGRASVSAIVSEKKHLKVTGSLMMDEGSEGEVRLGCIEIELYDNVNYREDGWLRIATTGISGTKFEEVKAPLFVDFNPFLKVPELEDSLDLAKFEGNSVKSYKSVQCFMIDLSDLPAQEYTGEIIVQYLKEDLTPATDEDAAEESEESSDEQGSEEGADEAGDDADEEATDEEADTEEETADEGDDTADESAEDDSDEASGESSDESGDNEGDDNL